MARGQLRTSAALQWVCLPAGLIFLGQELPTLSATRDTQAGPRSPLSAIVDAVPSSLAEGRVACGYPVL